MANFVKNRVWGDKPATGTGGDGGSDAFNGQRAITRNTPGMIGYDPDTTTVQAFLQNVFYPPIPPAVSISVNNPLREIGQSANYTLSYEVDQETSPVASINVDGTAVTPTGGIQTGTQTGTLPYAYGNYTKTITATDNATLSASASCTVQYFPRMFWGTIAKDGLSDAPILDSDILALANSNLQATRDLTLTDFGGGAQYLIFAIPSSYGTPSFTINGLANTAFTNVRPTSSFVNAEGATIIMDVWVSNYLYNSPLDSIIVN
jgi:hypothetical protein